MYLPPPPPHDYVCPTEVDAYNRGKGIVRYFQDLTDLPVVTFPLYFLSHGVADHLPLPLAIAAATLRSAAPDGRGRVKRHRVASFLFLLLISILSTTGAGAVFHRLLGGGRDVSRPTRARPRTTARPRPPPAGFLP